MLLILLAAIVGFIHLIYMTDIPLMAITAALIILVAGMFQTFMTNCLSSNSSKQTKSCILIFGQEKRVPKRLGTDGPEGIGESGSPCD